MRQFAVLTPTIGRQTDGMVFYSGPEDMCLTKACERVNECAKAGKLPAEEDMAMLERLPFLDEKQVEVSDLMFV